MPSGPSASPSPISTWAQCASGARSPEQPSEPYSCTTGVMPALSSAAMVSTTTGRTPVRPEASVFIRRNISARTTSRSTRGPIPAACERTRLRCNWARSSGLMWRTASAPKPVDTPYTGSGLAARASITSRARATPSIASGAVSTRAPSRATASTSSAATPWARTTTFCISIFTHPKH